MKKSLLLAGSLLLVGSVHASQTLTLDTSKTKDPISPYIYGQFIEHLGNCVNYGLWSELLQDRKFYYPVTENYSPWSVATDPFWNAGPYMYLSGSPWKVIEPARVHDAVTMDTAHTYVEDDNADAGPQIGQVIRPPEAPVLHLRPDGDVGISQENLQLTGGREYVGHILLRGDNFSGNVTVRMVMDDLVPRTMQTVSTASGNYTRTDFKFTAPGDSQNAHLEIVGRGSGDVEIGAISLMPADNIDGWRADTVALLKQLNAPIYRWPGGNFVSGYNWKDGIGPDRDKRPPRKNPAWKGVEPNDVGIAEYMDLMHLINSEPYVSVNTGLGTVAGVSQEVEYLNGAADTPMGKLRAANGHPAPYDVKWFAVGNEMFGNWQLGNMPLDQYVQKHNDVAKAIWSVDPDAKLVAVGDDDPNNHWAWDQSMFKVCANYMTLLSEHVYVKDKLDVVAHVAQLADEIRRVADAHRLMRQDIPELQGKKIQVAMDEWNYWYGDYIYGELGVRYHLKDALGIAKGYHEFFRNTDIFFMANYAQTVNVIGAIKTTSTAADFAATGLVQVMYRNHFGTIPIEVPQQPTGDLDVSAAWTADKKAITIAIVNPRTTPDEIDLKLGSTAIQDQATQWLIGGTDPLAYNEPGKPPNIVLQQTSLNVAGGKLPVPPLSVVMYRLDLR